VKPACFLLLSGFILARAARLFLMPSGLLLLNGHFYLSCAISVVLAGFLIGRRAPLLFAAVNSSLIALYLTRQASLFATLPGFHSIPLIYLVLLPTAPLFALALLAFLGAGSLEDAIARSSDVEILERLYQEAEYQRRLAEYLRELAARLTGELDTESLLRQITTSVTTLGYAGCCILLIEKDLEDRQHLVGHASTLEGLDASESLRYSETSPELRELLRGQIRRLANPAEYPGYSEALRERLRALGITDQLSLPIQYRNQILGALVVWAAIRPIEATSCQRNGAISAPAPDLTTGLAMDPSSPFSMTEVVYLSTLANHAALALGNAILHHEMREAHRRLGVEHAAVIEKAEELKIKNEELLAVQAELEAQYRALETANAQLSALATMDSMTGLANHRAFQEELARQIARVQRSRAPLSLVLLDVDYFKQYNDAFGHPAGDEVLKGVGQILRKTVREGDYPARYGGEEFAVILPDTDVETAQLVAERIRTTVEAYPFAHRKITVSIGLAEYLDDEAADRMIQRADVSLYEAKTGGRNQIAYLPVSAFGAEESLQDAPASAAQKALEVEQATLDVREAALLARLAAESAERETPADDSAWEMRASAPLSLQGYHRCVALQIGGLEGLLQEPTSQILSALLDVLDKRGVEPRGHSERVARYALHLSSAMAARYEEQRQTRPLLPRLTPGDLVDLAFGALLHDIGNVGIPDAILRKTGKLTENEWRQIRRHPLAGAELLADCPMLSRALPVVRFHHERWDGTGYPQGLSGEVIPLSARIFAVCDALDSLTTDRPYRARMDFAGACAEIARAAGAQFDPDVVEVFLRIPESEWQRLADVPLSAKSVSGSLSHAA
jgi:diguanylate cyclase (GGDEF)-like protein